MMSELKEQQRLNGKKMHVSTVVSVKKPAEKKQFPSRMINWFLIMTNVITADVVQNPVL